MVLFCKGNEKDIIMISYKRKLELIPFIPEKNMFNRELVMRADCFSFIDEDYSLLKYLCEETKYRDINKNCHGYITIRRKDGTVTTLGRFILEYYANFNDKLYTILNNEDYEINHINKSLEDNKIGNLEIVTKKGNTLHRDNKPYKDEIVMTSLELKKIQEEVMKKEKYNKDKEFMKRKSGLFTKGLKENNVTKEIIKWRCCLYFKYVNSLFSIQCNTHTNKNNNSNNNNNSIYNNVNIFLSKKYTKFILKLVESYTEHIFNEIITNNIQLLNRMQKRYPYLDKVISKFRINDRKPIKAKTIIDKGLKSRSALLDFLDDIKTTKMYCINDDNILVIYNIEALCVIYGKYNSFRIMYLLGLLNRRQPTGKTLNLRQRPICSKKRDFERRN